ncbi:MAG TPA: winged helix-turn-helix transcriptional regulator [Actinomycetota bacterium]|nr:winged helix-turn-helix transcriptional regulator [Actinomycetota bacterium]
MSSRDEYCPVYRSLDLFGDRWALLVVREILRGVTRFNELERSLPGISRSTLAQRLRHLEGEAIVTRRVGDDGRATEYGLTDAGRELMSIIKAINDWGVRWLLPEAGPWDKDPDGLMLWITRHVDLTALPSRRVVIRFELRGKGRRYFWLVLRTGEASLCPEHPGFQEDVFVTSSPPQLYRLVLGRQSLKQAIEEGSVRVEGPPHIIRSLPRWLILRSAGPSIPPAPATARLSHVGQKASARGPKPDTGPRSRRGSAAGSGRTDGRQAHPTKPP